MKIIIEHPDGGSTRIKTSRPWIADAIAKYSPYSDITVIMPHDGKVSLYKVHYPTGWTASNALWEELP